MIGIDLVSIPRIQRLLELFPSRFPHRILTTTELILMPSGIRSGQTASWLAKRFAAKEAVSKLVGTGICSRLSWHDIEIFNSPEGQPHLSLSPTAFQFTCQRLGFEPHLVLSLSDEPPYAVAVVVAYPKGIFKKVT